MLNPNFRRNGVTGAAALAAVFGILTLLPFWSAAQGELWTQNGSNIYYNTGNVGVGTAAPNAKLEISGGGIVIPNNQFLFGWNLAGNAARELTGLNSSNNIQIGGTGTHPITFFSASSEKIRMDTSGNVGIGTTTPSEKLVVNGNIKLSGSIISDGDICIGACD